MCLMPVRDPEEKECTCANVPPNGIPQEDGSAWAAIAAETGWTPTDCLGHKVTFAKRADGKAKVEILAEHMRRLRGAGWHLLAQTSSMQEEVTKAAADLVTEISARAEERTTAETRLRATAARVSGLEARAAAADAVATASVDRLRELEAAEARALVALRESREEVGCLRGEASKARSELATTSSALAAATAQVAEGQRYSSELQQYNATVQAELASARGEAAEATRSAAALGGEAAELRGTVLGLQAALSSLQASAGGREEAARHDAAETARLRAELAVATRERETGAAAATAARAELATAREELDRFRAATGAGVADAEASRARGEEAQERLRARAELAAGLADSLALAREESALAAARCDAAETSVRGLREEVARLADQLAAAERQVARGELLRRRLHNTIQELKGNIRVFCRVRPASSTDALPAVVVQGGNQATELSINSAAPSSGAVPSTHAFAFDRVFGPETGQDSVYGEISQLVQSALDGYNICIFAYGQTGAGKTHTMLGSDDEEGMIPRAMRQLFGDAAALAPQGWTYALRASVVEIYNEELRDLLGPKPPPGKKHTIMHDAKTGNTSVSFLEEVSVAGPEAVQQLLDRAMKQRAVGSTAMNEHSSRSHMVFTLSISGTNSETGQAVHGQLNLVDLAGSERLSRSGVEGKGVKETQAINKSLSALGDVIAALVNKDAHVPYRNSRLTHLLQGCLGGASGKALMFVHVAPEPASAQESLCSLRFAAKVAAVEVGTAKRQVAQAPQP